MSMKHLILTSAALLSVMTIPAFATEAVPAHQMDAAPSATGDVDVDFVKGMIPHHEAAVKSAKAYLDTKPKDPTLKRMAQQIIDSQTNEIDAMKVWLKKNPPKKVVQ